MGTSDLAFFCCNHLTLVKNLLLQKNGVEDLSFLGSWLGQTWHISQLFKAPASTGHFYCKSFLVRLLKKVLLIFSTLLEHMQKEHTQLSSPSKWRSWEDISISVLMYESPSFPYFATYVHYECIFLIQNYSELWATLALVWSALIKPPTSCN